MGINGPGRKATEEEIRQLWNDEKTGGDLRRMVLRFRNNWARFF